MLYTLMHKKIPVADVEIDSETANILSIPRLHNIEHIPIGIEIFDWVNFDALKDIDEEFMEIYKPSKYMDKMRIDKLLFSLKKRIEMLNRGS